MKTFLDKIGFISSLKCLGVLFLYGLIVTGYTGIFYNVNSDLPNIIQRLIQDPISLYPLAWLSLAGIFILIFVTRFGSIELEFYSQGFKRIIQIVTLSVCEVSTSLGMSILGVLGGITIALYVLNISTIAPNIHYVVFLKLTFFVALFIIPVVLLYLLLIDNKRQYSLMLNIFSALYVVLSLYLFFEVSTEINTISSMMSCFLIVFYVIKGLELHNNKKSFKGTA